jgi:hypothetical protein
LERRSLRVARISLFGKRLRVFGKVQPREFAVVLLRRLIMRLRGCLARTLWVIKPDLAEFERVKAFLISDC